MSTSNQTIFKSTAKPAASYRGVAHWNNISQLRLKSAEIPNMVTSWTLGQGVWHTCKNWHFHQWQPGNKSWSVCWKLQSRCCSQNWFLPQPSCHTLLMLCKDFTFEILAIARMFTTSFNLRLFSLSLFLFSTHRAGDKMKSIIFVSIAPV